MANDFTVSNDKYDTSAAIVINLYVHMSIVNKSNVINLLIPVPGPNRDRRVQHKR